MGFETIYCLKKNILIPMEDLKSIATKVLKVEDTTRQKYSQQISDCCKTISSTLKNKLKGYQSTYVLSEKKNIPLSSSFKPYSNQASDNNCVQNFFFPTVETEQINEKWERIEIVEQKNTEERALERKKSSFIELVKSNISPKKSQDKESMFRQHSLLRGYSELNFKKDLEDNDLKVPLQLNGIFSFFHTRAPTNDELVGCYKLFITPYAY